jgi:hypothetical protein
MIASSRTSAGAVISPARREAPISSRPRRAPGAVLASV